MSISPADSLYFFIVPHTGANCSAHLINCNSISLIILDGLQSQQFEKLLNKPLDVKGEITD